jgi:hypothetical protein
LAEEEVKIIWIEKGYVVKLEKAEEQAKPSVRERGMEGASKKS